MLRTDRNYRLWLAALIVMVTTQARSDAGTDPSCGMAASCDLPSCVDCNSCESVCVPCAAGCECDKCGFGSLLKQFIRPSDHCFDDFISPMSNFIFFEDPRTLTEARAIYFHHETPDQVGTLNLPGGEVELLALQLRFALTERLSVIAVKDGFIMSDMNGGPLDALLDDGWADVTAGLKYNLLRDPCAGTIVSGGFTYEIPIGSQRSLQDIGDGEFHFFLTGGQRLCGGLGHALSSVGFRLPVDDSVQTTSIHWSNHVDVKLTDRFYLFTEVVWWHWTDDAEFGLPLGVAGHDAFNLFSTNAAGNDLVLQSVGAKYKPSRHLEIGANYEFPLTGFEDITSERVQLEMIFRY